uniref:Uncharacterized protein n=1 Tax=Rhizophora mucronata TaxID=61149 RepID=A0A2P2NKW3_RHIMU
MCAASNVNYIEVIKYSHINHIYQIYLNKIRS